MSPFRYLRDPLFMFCVTLYFVNRWVLKPLLPGAFFHSSLNDLICIPFWVPLMLWAMRKAKLRHDDCPPRWYEIAIPLIVWSWAFELLLPFAGPFRRWAVSDPMDIFWYAVGACSASLFWRIWYGKVFSPAAHAVE